MNKFLLVAFLTIVHNGFSQCPFPVSLDSTGNCLDATLKVNTTNTISRIIWYNGSMPLDTVYSTTFTSKLIAGGNGEGPAANQFNFPDAIYIDAPGNLYVSDGGNYRVQKFSPGASNGTTVAGGNGPGGAANQVDFPRGLYVDPSGNIYVAEDNNNRVQKWAPGATSGVTVAGGNGAGLASNQLTAPYGLYVDASGNMYIADNGNNRVQKWAPGATSGVTVAGGNGAGSAANQLDGLLSVYVDAGGNVYVADQNNNRIQKWAPGATSGITVAGGNGVGNAANQLYDPVAVWVDGTGNIYIADYINDRVQKWAPSATSGVTVAGGDLPNQTGTIFVRPTSLYVDGNGNIFVGTSSNSIQEWSSGLNTGFLTTYNPQMTGPGMYTALVTDIYGCSVKTNSTTIYPYGNPVISISRDLTVVNSCSKVTITASVTNAGSSPLYQWQINGTNAGSNSPSFTYGNWHNADVVNCTVTSNSPCASTPTAISNSISMTVSGQSSVTLNSKGATCLGDTLFINTTDSVSQIIWYNNNNSVDTSNAIPSGVGITVAGGNGIGYAANQLYTPFGIYMDASNNLYVVDEKNHRIQKWLPGATSGLTVAQSSLADPTGVFIDANGYIYVSDILLNSVVKFPPGSDANTIGVTVAGGNGPGTAANQLNSPRYMFVDASGNLYVIDQMNERVQKFPPGSTSSTNGVTIAGNLGDPIGIFVDGAGNVYIGESGYGDVQKWAPGATSGVIVAGGNGQGSAANQLDAPGEIYVDKSGNIYIADEVNNRVVKWAPGATSGVIVAGGNGEGLAANQLSDPEGLFLDGNGNVYATDYLKNSVQKWAQLSTIDTTYKPTSAGSYTATVINSSGCSITSNPIVINPIVKPSVTIISSVVAGCAGTPITFTATPVNGGTNPIYQWQMNGINVGNNSPTYTSTIINGSKIKCILTSNAPCTSVPSDTSKEIVIVTNNPITPSISITASQTNICTGTPVTFNANPLNAGTNPSYQWLVNGINAGNNSPDFTSNSLADGDVISCVMAGSVACTTNPTDTSNIIIIRVITDVPSVSISSSAVEICSGDVVTFTATEMNAASGTSYQWQVNGIDVGKDDNTYTDSNFLNADVIKCILKSNAACSNVVSNNIVLQVDPLPSVNSKIISITPGQSITLDPSIAGNVVGYIWSPSTYLSDISVLNPVASPPQNIVYTLQVTTAEGCKASGNITVKVFTQLSVPNAFTPNGDGKNDIFYLLGGQLGGTIKTFSVFNRWGQIIFEKKNIQSDDPNVGWNGNYKGMPADAGTYVYIINYVSGNGEKKIFKGTVELVR